MDKKANFNINALADYVQKNNVNLCPSGDYENWTSIAYDLSALGEEGKEIFHTISSVDDSYRHRDCEVRFNYELARYCAKFDTFQPSTCCNVKFVQRLIDKAIKCGVDITLFYSKVTLKAVKLTPEQKKIALDIHSADPRDWSIPMNKYMPCLQYDEEDVAKRTFFKPIIEVFGLKATFEATKNYQIGLVMDADITWREFSKTEVIFPYIDNNGYLRSAKKMVYNADGHRNHRPVVAKNPNRSEAWNELYKEYVCGTAMLYAPVWYHTIIKKSLPSTWKKWLCPFGLHLVNGNDKDICIVESEKTALVCSIAMPDRIWLATGGKSFLEKYLQEYNDILSNRHITIYPDVDAFNEWKSVAERCHPSAQTVNWFSKLKHVGEKEDLADVLLRNI